MKRTKRKLSAVLPAVALCALCVGEAGAAEGDYVLKDGKVYRTEGGKQTLVEDATPERAQTAKGLFSWITVAPGRFDGMKGSEGGFHFFLGEDEKPAGFLPMKDAGDCLAAFSPSGEKLLTCCGKETRQEIGYHLVDAKNGSFEKSFVGRAHPFWIDDHRFLFTAIDEGKGPRSGTDDAAWWFSAALYDSAVDNLIVLKEAAETRSYIVGNREEDNAVILELSVKDAKDWSDEDKIEAKEITLPIPPAG